MLRPLAPPPFPRTVEAVFVPLYTVPVPGFYMVLKGKLKRDGQQCRQWIFKRAPRGVVLPHLNDLTLHRDLVCTTKQSGCPE